MRKIENLQRQLSEGRIGRRDFIKQATAMGMPALQRSSFVYVHESAGVMARSLSLCELELELDG